MYTTPNYTLQFTDSATYVIGKHNLKFGGEFRTGGTDNLRNTFGSGEIRFSDLESFTTGDVRSRAAILYLSETAGALWTRNLSELSFRITGG